MYYQSDAFILVRKFGHVPSCFQHYFVFFSYQSSIFPCLGRFSYRTFSLHRYLIWILFMDVLYILSGDRISLCFLLHVNLGRLCFDFVVVVVGRSQTDAIGVLARVVLRGNQERIRIIGRLSRLIHHWLLVRLCLHHINWVRQVGRWRQVIISIEARGFLFLWLEIAIRRTRLRFVLNRWSWLHWLWVCFQINLSEQIQRRENILLVIGSIQMNWLQRLKVLCFRYNRCTFTMVEISIDLYLVCCTFLVTFFAIG